MSFNLYRCIIKVYIYIHTWAYTCGYVQARKKTQTHTLALSLLASYVGGILCVYAGLQGQRQRFMNGCSTKRLANPTRQTRQNGTNSRKKTKKKNKGGQMMKGRSKRSEHRMKESTEVLRIRHQGGWTSCDHTAQPGG